MLSMTYSESLRSVSSRCHSDWALHPVRQTDTLELQRLREVRAAAQARNMESFLRMHGLSLDGCTARRTGMKYRHGSPEKGPFSHPIAFQVSNPYHCPSVLESHRRTVQPEDAAQHWVVKEQMYQEGARKREGCDKTAVQSAVFVQLQFLGKGTNLVLELSPQSRLHPQGLPQQACAHGEDLGLH
ncbi:hypothetical protein TREES_T100008682 [Tupaia chinensis]|uniref:Uncharacterized protein n=1 Tax=Tupaia chinensis TaxID=246437 RepID=L9L174_TUPCH|nr:hypothetical protein TREES_T100008682 [Tupaia chinensis]